MSEEENDVCDVMSMVKTDHGYAVMLYPEALCRVFGGHGLKVSPDGDIEVLLVDTEGTGWVDIVDARLVQTGRTRTSVRRQ